MGRPPALVLRGSPPPPVPKFGSRTVACRVSPPEYAFLERCAAQNSETINSLLRSWIRDRMRVVDGLPDDVRLWLLIMAAQLGIPGEWERALVAVVRNLAADYPEGVRLDDPLL